MENIQKNLLKILSVIFLIIIIIYNFFIKNDKELITNDFIINSASINNTIINEKSEKIKIYITGQIKNPGVIELEENSRIEDAINLAGGLTELANLNNVNLAYCLEDGQKLYIPSINDQSDISYISIENGTNIIQETNFNSQNSKININKADIVELQNLPGVGESLAQKIINYRNENGKFNSIEDLKNVSGIGEKKFESLKEYIDT